MSGALFEFHSGMPFLSSTSGGRRVGGGGQGSLQSLRRYYEGCPFLYSSTVYCIVKLCCRQHTGSGGEGGGGECCIICKVAI